MSRKDYITIAAILAKHDASEEMITAFCAELKEDNPRFDAQRFRGAVQPMKHTLYVASAWWRDCDAFCTVAGNDARRVEKAINRAIKDAAIDVFNTDSDNDNPNAPKRWQDCADDIAWSGVNTFAFDAIIPKRTIENYESDSPHADEMHYHDYVALRDGDADAVVYLR